MDAIQMAIPDVELRCFDLGSMSMQQQVLMVEKASVHVSPQGGLSYLSLFAQEGASLVLLVMLRRLSCAPTLCNQTFVLGFCNVCELVGSKQKNLIQFY